MRKGSPIGVAVHNVTTGNSFNKQELPLCAETSRFGSHWECRMDVEAAHSFLVNWKAYVLCLLTVIISVNLLAMSLLLMRCNLWLQRTEERSWPAL